MFKGYFIAVIISVWVVILAYLGYIRIKEKKVQSKGN